MSRFVLYVDNVSSFFYNFCMKKKNESKTELGALFAVVRKGKGITQNDIAEAVGLARSAIAQFERGHASLSNDTLIRIAPLLNINPDYISIKEVNPFKSGSNDLIKLYLPENTMTLALDYSLIYFLAATEANRSLDFLFLSPDVRAASIANPFEAVIYAIAVRDSANNIFLFRRKLHMAWGSVTGEKELQTRITQLSEEKGKKISFKIKKIDSRLYEIIREWTAVRRDIEPLFESAEIPLMSSLTDAEKKLIAEMRTKKISPSKVIRSLDEFDKKH